MNDEGDVSRTPLDSGVDKNINEPLVRGEKYKNGLASEHNKTIGNIDKSRKSWTMSQLDRSIASGILSNKVSKLAQYGIGLNRKNDFRLGDLSDRLNRDLTRDFDKEIKEGPISKRLRDFDIKSQSMRMITANATLGSYQFQKTQTLPYMRRNLALGYQKVDLLKRVVGGIGSLEKAVVSKLEAIKMNTAAPETSKVSLFRQIKDEMRSQQVKKIASNLTDVVMQGYNKTYKKHVMPITKRLHEIMSDTSRRGGPQGVIDAVTKKANELRRSLRDSHEDTTNASGLDKVIGTVKNKGTKLASKALGAGVSLGQKITVPERINNFVRGRALGFTEFWSKANPFSKPKDDDDEEHPSVTSRNGISPIPLSGESKLLSLMTGWYKDYKSDTRRIIDHLEGIRHNTTSGLPGPMNKRRNNFSRASARRLTNIKDTVDLPDMDLVGDHTDNNNVNDRRRPIFGNVKDKLDRLPSTDGIKDILHNSKEALNDRVSTTSKSVRNAASQRIKQSLEERKKKAEERRNATPKPKPTPVKVTPRNPKPEKPKITRPKTAVSTVERAPKEKGKSLLSMGAGELGSHLGQKGVGLAGSALKGGAKLAGRAAKATAVGGAKLVGKVAMVAPGLAWGATKLGAKGAWGATKLGANALGAVGRFGGGLAFGAGKAALGGLGRGALSFAKSGAGMSLGVGLAGTGINYLSDKYLTGGTKRLGKTAGTAMQYGALGATIGSVIPGIGTAIGGGIGAAVGALVANMDYVSKGVKFIGDGFAYSAKSLMDMSSSFTKSAGEALAAFKKKIADTASSVGNAVSSGASAVGSAVSSGASYVGGAISSGASAIYSGAVSAVKMAGDGLSRAKDAVAYLTKKGWSKAAALGIVANLFQESKLNTQIVGDSGRAIGIAQWHPDRQNEIRQKFGKHPAQMNLNEQLDAVDWELRSGKQFKSTHLQALQGAKDPGTAAALVSEFYERPADKQGEKQKRAGIANKLAGSVGGATDTKPTSTSGTSTPTSTKDKLWANAKTSNSLKDPNTSVSSSTMPTPGKMGIVGTGADFGMGPKSTNTKTIGNQSGNKLPDKPKPVPAKTEEHKTEVAKTTPVTPKTTPVDKSVEAIHKLASAVEQHTHAVKEHTTSVKTHADKVVDAAEKTATVTNKQTNIHTGPTGKPKDSGAFVTMSMKKVPVRTGLAG